MKRLKLVLGGIAAVLVLAIAWVAVISESRLSHVHAVEVPPRVPDPGLAAEGRQLARSRGCMDCHGEDLGGHVVLDEPLFARVVGDNLLRPPEGQAGATTWERMYRALVHGVDLESRPLLMMPSASYTHLSLHEIEAIAAYVEGLPSGGRDLPASRLGPIGRVLLATGQFEGMLPVEVIDHHARPIERPPPIGTAEYGRHVAQLCVGCHRADFAGGPVALGQPDWPPAANLTPHASGLARWSQADFMRAMREGRRPDGSGIDAEAMPWRAFGQASDAELLAVWRFLRSLPPVDRGGPQNARPSH